MKTTVTILFAVTALGHSAITFNLSGNTETSGWNQLNNSNSYWADNGFTTSYPGATPWPGSIEANMAGSSGSAVFSKLSGNGYFGNGSIYDGGGAGTFSISDETPMESIATIILQLDVGTSIGGLPTLNYNGGAQALAADYSGAVAGDHSTVNFSTGQLFPTSNNLFQWDVSGLEISEYEIIWGSVPNNHLSQYEINLTSGDTFTQVVPEPSTALLGLGVVLLAFRRRR